ncbi:MAG: LLM class F420-dependent oxidoreductase [Candidatus Rokuibacteriota bacterium]
MDIGCQLPMVPTREALTTFAREAEQRRMASLWVSDHVIIPHSSSGYPGGRFPHPPDKPYLEPVTVLAAAAMVTSQARVGASVFVLGHRHPILMAKMLTTIDALSGGRLICGVGVGWWKQELEALGTPFETRGRRADEMLRVFKELWTSDNPRFEGEFYRFSDIGFSPRPVQKPHPPLWVGGDSPGAFRRVVALGDGWHASGKTPAEMRDRIGKLRALADAAKRPWESLTISLRFGLTDALLQQGVQAVIDLFGEYKHLGLVHLMVDFRRDDLGRMLEILDLLAAKIRPAVDAG